MAGIGFSLRSAYRRDGIIDKVAALGHATIIAAGPWLLTVLSLGFISIIAEQVSGLTALAEFRAAIIYAFLLSLIAVAPVVIVATRIVADALYASRLEDVLPTLHGSLYLSLLVVTPLCVVVFGGIFRLPLPYALAVTVCTMTIALIWVAMAFCGTIKDYRGITRAFLVGLGVAVPSVILLSLLDFGTVHMVLAFSASLSLTFLLLAERLFSHFDHPAGNALAEIETLARAMRKHVVLALGALLGGIAIWIDKLVVWLSPIAETLPTGLAHAPIYDSAMFVAYLAIIPSLAIFVLTLETSFFERYRAYFGSILGHGTLRSIESRRAVMEEETLANLNRGIIVQAAICTLVVAFSPALIELLNFQFRQVSVLQMGVIGALFQFIFFVASTVIIFFDRQKLFFALQALALALNGGLTFLFGVVGPDYLGFGYLVAFTIAGLIAYLAMAQTLRDLNYLSFVGNNPAS